MTTTVAVTGATGFIGGHIVDTLTKLPKVTVTAVGRKPVPHPKVQHLLWDGTTVPGAGKKFDVIIHCAAVMRIGNTAEDMRACQFNINSLNLLHPLKDTHGNNTFVHMSSASVYTPGKDRHNISEDYPTGGCYGAYARTKQEADTVALGTGHIVLRPHAVYGDGDNHLLPRLQKTIRNNVLPLPGKTVEMSLTHIGNMVDAVVHSTGLSTGKVWPAGAYNISDWRNYDRDDTARKLFPNATIVHMPTRALKLAIKMGTAPENVTAYTLDQVSKNVTLNIGKACSQGWRPQLELGDWLT